MKKLVAILVLCLTCAFCAIGFAACDENTTGGQDTQILSIYNTYVAYAEENGETPLSYEEWFKSIKGDTGATGVQGEKGEKGDTGKTPEIRVMNGYIQWKYTDEEEWHNLVTVETAVSENPQELDFYPKEDGSYEVKVGKAALLTEIDIPSTYKGKAVTSIGNRAFEDCRNLTSITIPDSVITIGNDAFRRCNSITNIIIPNNVIEIGSAAFEECFGLKEIKISDSVDIIGYNAFGNCNGLTNIIVDNNNPNYSSQDGILYDKNKTEIIQVPRKISGIINLPNTLTNIDRHAFFGISGLTGIMVDDSNPNYSSQDGILYNKEKTQIVWVPNIISGEIILPDTLTNIEYDAFYGCSSLTSITIPNTVTSIEGYAFYGCSKLTSITIPNSVTSIEGHAFYGCSSLTSITIPNSVTSIGNGAFYNCSSLTSVTFENTNGWKVGWTDISSSDLANTSTAAQYLTSTYYYDYWQRG